MDQNIIPAGSQAPLVAAPDSSNMLPAILQAACTPGLDVEKMERLIALHERAQAKQAEEAFGIAMSEAQSEIGRIGTDKTNKQTNSSYATYAKLDRELRPIYSRHGFALSFGTAPTDKSDVLIVTCNVMHRAGHSMFYQIPMPADGKGAKGNDVMTKTHATGSAASYGMRYLLKMIFNVAVGEDPDDDDGNAAGGMGEQPNASEALINAWINAIYECKTVEELGGRRRKMIDTLGGGDVNNVPAPIRKAAAAMHAKLVGEVKS